MNPEEVNTKKKKKLSGAAKRRRKRCNEALGSNPEITSVKSYNSNKELGFSITPGEQKPLQPEKTFQNALKRHFSIPKLETNSPMALPPGAVPFSVAKKPEASSSVPAFKQTITKKKVDPFRVGICCNNMPMTEGQLGLLRSSILSAINRKNGGSSHRFLCYSFRPGGWLLTLCEDQESQEWLISLVPNLRPWPGAKLSIMRDDQLPKPTTGFTFAPKSEAKTVDQVLNLLEAQNNCLYTHMWKILDCRDQKGGWILTFSFDDISAETLRIMRGQASLGFQKISFKLKEGEKPTSHSETGPPTSNLPSSVTTTNSMAPKITPPVGEVKTSLPLSRDTWHGGPQTGYLGGNIIGGNQREPIKLEGHTQPSSEGYLTKPY